MITTDVWIADEPPEFQEFHDFDMRMAGKMMAGVDLAGLTRMGNSMASMVQPLGAPPGSADALVKMGEELAKLKGFHVMEITSMGGSGSGPGVAQGATSTTPSPAPGASDSAAQPAAGESRTRGLVGAALNHSVLGTLRRKKAQPAEPAPNSPPTTPTQPGPETAGGGILVELTQQQTNFSREAIPQSSFEVPRGFKRVESPMERMSSK